MIESAGGPDPMFGELADFIERLASVYGCRAMVIVEHVTPQGGVARIHTTSFDAVPAIAILEITKLRVYEGMGIVKIPDDDTRRTT